VWLWISNVQGWGGAECVGGEVILLNIPNDVLIGGGGDWGFSINEEHLHSLLQAGAARKGCWLRFFEFCAASCLSTCFSVWSIGLLHCKMLAVAVMSSTKQSAQENIWFPEGWGRPKLGTETEILLFRQFASRGLSVFHNHEVTMCCTSAAVLWTGVAWICSYEDQKQIWRRYGSL
jgi:hypothetical protein